MAETTLYQDLSRSWINCPPEILITIFRNLDNKSLLTCLSVSQQWRAIADYIIQIHRNWKIVAEDNMVCGGVTFERKSKLNWNDIYMNSLLWQKVNNAIMLHVFTYSEITFENLIILNVNVYKDNLIAVTHSGAKYYDIETCIFRKQIEIMSCLDYNESDNIILISYYTSITDANLFKCLCLFGKLSIDNDSCSLKHAKFLSNVLLYKLENNACYVLTSKNILWRYKWDGKNWNEHFRARYYHNNHSIVSLHVHRQEVYILSKSGQILLSDVDSMCFTVVANSQYDMSKTSTCPVMFGSYNVVCGVPSNEDVESKYIDYVDNMLMVCPGLSCAAQHGHVLFLGFETGQVKICIWKPQRTDKPYNMQERILDIRQFDKNTSDFKIIAINVYEAKNCHHLFICTSNYIYC